MEARLAGAGGSRGPQRVLAGFLAVALFVISSAVVIRQWRGEYLLSQARQSLDDNDGRSEVLLKQALRYGREDAAVALARIAYGRRDWDAFHDYADEALRLNPYQGYVNMLRAYALASERMPEDPAEAEKILGECRRAVAVDPGNGGLWLNYAELAFRIYRHMYGSGVNAGKAAGYRRESLAGYGRALRLDPAAALEVVDALAAGGDASFTVAALRGAAPAALRRAAAIFLDRGEWEAVRAEYLTGAGEGEAKRNAYRAAAEELRSRTLHGEFLDVMKDYTFASPEDAYLAYLAALSAEALGPRSEHRAAAEKYHREALRLDGANNTYRVRLAALLVKEKKFAAAEPILRQVTAEIPGNDWSWFNLGRAVERGGREEEALTYYRRALKLKPENAGYRRALESLENKTTDGD